jgi:hypothetical protein
MLELCSKSDTDFLLGTLDYTCSEDILLRRAMMNGDNFISIYDLRRIAFCLIKKTYHEKARKDHPDMGGNASAFRSVQEAWEILRDNSVVLTPETSMTDQVKVALDNLAITPLQLRCHQFGRIMDKVQKVKEAQEKAAIEAKAAEEKAAGEAKEAEEKRDQRAREAQQVFSSPAKENLPPVKDDKPCKKKYTAAPPTIRRRSARLAAKNA